MYELESTTANDMRDEIVKFLFHMVRNYRLDAHLTPTFSQKMIYEAKANVLEAAATILKDAKVVVL